MEHHRNGKSFSDLSTSGEYPNVALRASQYQLVNSQLKPVGPLFTHVSDAVDFCKVNSINPFYKNTRICCADGTIL